MGWALGWALVSPLGAGHWPLVSGDLRSRDYQHKTDYRREGESLRRAGASVQKRERGR
jgi:hypothetical protein